jgi:dolichol kinase
MKLVITILVILTFPIWILPAGVAMMVWGVHDAIWGERHPYD